MSSPGPAGGASFFELRELYNSDAAHQLYDEVVTELEHALQAAQLAEVAGQPAAVVTAALLHDVGHLVLGDNVAIDEPLEVDARHEAAGARYLAQWFGPEVTAPVALHVEAKRYLCAVRPGYHESLSASSVRSLELQGGVHTPEQAQRFEALPGATHAVLVRTYDDLAKDASASPPNFDHFTVHLGACHDGRGPAL